MKYFDITNVTFPWPSDFGRQDTIPSDFASTIGLWIQKARNYNNNKKRP